MGTDIHLYVETRDKNGEWHSPTEQNPYYTPPEKRLAKAREYRQYSAALSLVPYEKRPFIPESEAVAIANDSAQWDSNPNRAISRYDGRNYGLFAILADVRNGRGFAGTDLGNPTEPIAEPRGIPSDASAAYLAEVRDDPGHDYSYFTLGELYAHDWDRKVVNRSMVRRKKTAPTLAHRPELSDPDQFATQIEKLLNQYGRDVYSWDSWDAEYCGWSSEGREGGWRSIQWTTTHRDQVGGEFMRLMFELGVQAHREGLTPDDIRIVFFFDS